MKIYYRILSIYLLSFCLQFQNLVGQSLKPDYIGAKAGIGSYVCDLLDIGFIRSNISDFSYEQSILNVMFIKNAGIDFEYMILDNRFGLSSGLRYTQLKGNYDGGNNGFYVLLSESGTTTEYLKLKSISQNSSYIGIPIEVRYFLYDRSYFFNLYCKVGFDFNLKVSDNMNVDFMRNEMDIYQKDIASKFSPPGSFYSTFFLSGGISLGEVGRTTCNLELFIPVPLTSNTSSILKPITGGGAFFTIQLPLKKSQNEK